MPKRDLGYHRPGGPDGDTAAGELQAFQSALRGLNAETEIAALGHSDQFERDIAEIERATAALRRGEPALEAWNESWSGDAPAPAGRKPRPVWLLIGLLWLSSALLTVGAVAAIARLAG